MTSVGNIDNCYKYIYKNLLFFVFLLLMVSDLGLIQVSYADFPNDPVDTDITSAFGYDYGNDNEIQCYKPDGSSSQEVDMGNYKYVYQEGNNGPWKELSYGSNGFSSKFFKCVDLGYIVTGNFSADDYAPCSAEFDYANYKNKLNYISFNKDSTKHLFVIVNGGNVCDLNKVKDSTTITLFGVGNVNGKCAKTQDKSCGYESDNTTLKWCYADCYGSDNNNDCVTYTDKALPAYVVTGGDKPDTITEFYVFKKNKNLSKIEKNRSTFPGQIYNCYNNTNKDFYLPPCGKNKNNENHLYDSGTKYDEYFQALNSNTNTSAKCLINKSDISYCSDLENGKLKYEDGLKYLDNGLPTCFLKSCADLTSSELIAIKGKNGKYCSEYRYLINSNGLKYFPKDDLIKEKNGKSVGNDRKAIYCSDLNSDGELAFPSGQNKNKNNCYLKRCINLNAKERRKVILANLGNFDRKLARIDYEHNVMRGEEIDCPADSKGKYAEDCPKGKTTTKKLSQPQLKTKDNNTIFGEAIKYTYYYDEKDKNGNPTIHNTHYMDMNQGNIKQGLAKYCEDEVFFVNGTLDKFDDLLLNTLTSKEVNGGNCVDFTTLFINKDSYYSINNENYNSKTGGFHCRTLMVPVYNTEFNDSKSFVCNVVITKDEGGTLNDGYSSIFPDCSIKDENDNTKSYGTYDKISIKDIAIGSEYINVLKNIDNTLLFLNAEILDLDKTENYKCTALNFKEDANPDDCNMTKISAEDKKFFTEDNVKKKDNNLKECSMLNTDEEGGSCAEENKVYELDLLKTYNIPEFSRNSSTIINSKNNTEKSIEKFLVDINNYNFNNNTEYVNYQEKKGGEGDDKNDYVVKDSFFDCGLYALVDFEGYIKGTDDSKVYDDKYNVYYNNFSSNREFSELVDKIRKKCKAKYLPLGTPQDVLIYNDEGDKSGNKYGQKPLSYNTNGISKNIESYKSGGKIGGNSAAFGCYLAKKGTNTHFCKIPGDESFYIAEYRTLNGYSNDGKTMGSEEYVNPKKPGQVRLQVAACIRHPNDVFVQLDKQNCGERGGSGIDSRCVVLDSNYIEDDANTKKGKLSLVKNYITNEDLEGVDSRNMLYRLSIDGTSDLAGMYDLTAFRDNSNFFRTDRYGRNVYVFYDFATNYMCTTANKDKHTDDYAIAVVTAECFGIGLAGGLVAGVTATIIAAAFIFTLPTSGAIGVATGTSVAATAFGICEGIRLGGGEADFTFSNDLYNMKDYYENDVGNGFYSNLNITNNNNTLYNYYRRSDDLKEDLKYKLEGKNKNYAGEYGDKNVLSKEIIKKCELEDFVVRERVCWDGTSLKFNDNGDVDKKCAYAEWSMYGGSGENYQYLIQNYNANFDDQDNLKCKYTYFNKSQGLGSSEEKDGYERMCVISINEDDESNSCFDKPENCLTDEQKKCLKEYGVHFFTNAQKLMDKTDYDKESVKNGKNYGGINYLDFLKGYGDGYFTRAAYGTLDYNNGIVSINMVESAQNAVGEGNTKKDCKLDQYGNPIGDLQKCRGYSYCKNGYDDSNKKCKDDSEVFVKENQSIKIGLQTSPQPFFTIANPQNTYDLFSPFLELVAYYPYNITPNSDYSNAKNYEGYDFKLNLFNPVLLFKYDFPGVDDKFKNKYTTICSGKSEVLAQDCGAVWAEIPYDSNVSPIYNLQYKSDKGGDREDNFYFYLSKEFTIDGDGVETPTVCLHQLDRLSDDFEGDFGVFMESKDGVKYAMKERNIFCYDRKYPSIGDIFMKPTNDFSYQNSYINTVISNNSNDILSKFGNNVYACTRITDNTKFNIENDAKNNVQNLVFSFKRNECTRLENDYYMNQFEMNSGNVSRSKLIELQDDNEYIKSVIKSDCDLQNGSPYYVVSGSRKYNLKKNYGAYGGFNEVCLSNKYVNKFKSEYDIDYDVIAYQNENSVDGKCFLNKLSRSSNSCLVSKKVYAPCEEIYGEGEICNKNMYHSVDGKLEVIDVINSTTGESTKIVEIDCELFRKNVVSIDYEYEYARNNPELYINKMKACYKGGYNSAGNLYSDKNKYDFKDGVITSVGSEVKSDYSCSCMKEGNDDDYKKIKNSIDNGLKNLKNKNFYSYFAYRAPTTRELSLCVDLVDSPKCDAVEYRTVGGIYVDPDLSVPEQVSSSMLVLGDTVECYPNMSCNKDASTKVGAKYNAGLNQHFWRTDEKLFGVLASSIYGSLGHAEFESTLYCENNTDLCIGKNGSDITGSCNGYWTVGNSAPTAVCKPVNCNKFEDNEEKKACENRYDSVDTNGFALDENGDYVYEYDLNKNNLKCVRYRCPGIFSDIQHLLSVDDNTGIATYSTVRSIVTDELEFSINTSIVKGSVTDEENDSYGRASKEETDFKNVKHFIDYSESDANADQRGRSHGFAVWTETDEDGNVLDGIESSDIVQLATANRCLTGYAPAGTNYNREMLLDNFIQYDFNNITNAINDIDDKDLYCKEIDNGGTTIYDCSEVKEKQKIYMELIKSQINYIYNNNIIINKDRLPKRYCGQRGNWLDTRDIYSNEPNDIKHILYYTGNETWLNTLLFEGYLKGSNVGLFNTTTDGVYNRIYKETDIDKPTGDYKAGYISLSDSNKYCERLFCPDVSIDRYDLGENIDQIEYDIYGMEKRPNTGTSNDNNTNFDNKIYSYTDKYVKGADNAITRYTTWKHTAGATWENIAAPRNDSRKLCIGESCSDSKNINKILEDRSVPDDLEDKNINKFLKKVRGICHTEYGYYERNSIFIGQESNQESSNQNKNSDADVFTAQLTYIKQALDEEYKADIFGSQDIDISSSYNQKGDIKINDYDSKRIYDAKVEHSIDPRKLSMQQLELDDEKIPVSGVLYKVPKGDYVGIEPTRTCNSAGIWSGVSDGCFRACEMLDLYNVKVSPDINERRFDSYYRYINEENEKGEINSEMEIDKSENGKPLYVKNSDIKAIQFFNSDDTEKNYRNMFNIIQNIRYTKNLVDIEKTGAGTSYGDYLTGGAMWPRTVVNLNNTSASNNDSECGKIECVDIEVSHYGYDEEKGQKKQHCETVRCDSNGRRLRYIEVPGVCDIRFNTIALNDAPDNENEIFDDEARNYFNNRTKSNEMIIPTRRCYEDGVWGPVYGPTRCVLQRSCKPLYFNPKNLYYLIHMYDYYYNNNKIDENKQLINDIESYISTRGDESIKNLDLIENLDLIKNLINNTQSILTNILSNKLILENKNEINTKNNDYTSRASTKYTMGLLNNNQISDVNEPKKSRSGKFEGYASAESSYLNAESSYQLGYELYCNVGSGNPWLVAYYDDNQLGSICNQNNGVNVAYDCAIYADLGRMIKPKVCNNSIYEDMDDKSRVVNRLKHKFLRDPNVECDGKDKSKCKTTTSRINKYNSKEGIINDNYSVEMYVKTSYLQKVYNEQKMDGLININKDNKFGNEFNKFEDSEYYKKYYSNVNLENESMKNITLGTHEYISFQGHTKCDEDYFYNNELTNKQYGIDDYQVVYECRLDNNKDTKIGFPSEDKNTNYGGKIISPSDCAPKYCGERSKYVSAHRNWTVAHVGKVALKPGDYGYDNSKDGLGLPKGQDQFSSLKCPAGYAFVIQKIENDSVAVGENGDLNDIYNKKINSREDSDDDQLRKYRDIKIIDYYDINNSEDYNVNNSLNIDSSAISEQAKRGGWVKSINLGCYSNDYDINKSIENGISIPLDRTFGRLGADGIDYNTTITFCRDIAQTDCHELKLADTFNDDFLEDSYFNSKGYCVFMGCRFNDINFIYLGEKDVDGIQKSGTVNGNGQTKLTSIVNNDLNIIQVINGCNKNDSKCNKTDAELQFGDTFAVGGESEYDKCNYKIGNNSGSCKISQKNLCPSGYDQYTKGLEDPINYEEYIFSGKSNIVDNENIDSTNEEYDVCREYVASADINKNKVTYNDDYNNFISPYSSLTYSGGGSIMSDDIRNFDKLVVERLNILDNGSLQNDVVWNVCSKIKSSFYINIGEDQVYKKVIHDGIYYTNGVDTIYYKYKLCRSDGCKGDNLNYGVSTDNCSDLLCNGRLNHVYYLYREDQKKDYNINVCYEDRSNGEEYAYRYKFDNLNSIDKDSDENFVRVISFDKIKEKFDSLSGNCLYATNDNFMSGKCSYNENFLTYQKLLRMKYFLSNGDNLAYYKTLINKHINDEFYEELKEAKTFSFEFNNNTLYVCYTNEINTSDGGDIKSLNNICVITIIGDNDITQELYNRSMLQSSSTEIELDSTLVDLNTLSTLDSNYIKKLQEYTKILYNDFLDYVTNDYKITKYELNKNKEGIKELKNKINTNCGPESNLFKAYKAYYNDVKESNEKLKEKGVDIYSGFYTLFRCDLKTGKIKTYGNDNEEMVCAKRCNGRPDNKSDDNWKDWYYLNPVGTGDFYYRFKNIKNLRHNETFSEYIYARQESGRHIDSHRVNLSCDNGSFVYTKSNKSMQFEVDWFNHKGNLECFFGEEKAISIKYSYNITRPPYAMVCYYNNNNNNYKAIRSRRKLGKGRVENIGQFNYLGSKKHPFLKYEMEIEDRSDSGLAGRDKINDIVKEENGEYVTEEKDE